MRTLKKGKDSSEAVVTSTDDLVKNVADHFYCLNDDVEDKEWNRGVIIEKTRSSKYLPCHRYCQGRFYTQDFN